MRVQRVAGRTPGLVGERRPCSGHRRKLPLNRRRARAVPKGGSRLVTESHQPGSAKARISADLCGSPASLGDSGRGAELALLGGGIRSRRRSAISDVCSRPRLGSGSRRSGSSIRTTCGFRVRTAARGELTNSVCGTIYSRAGRTPPVAHFAGCAPSGFGYRRLYAGEQLTVQVVAGFLRIVSERELTFHQLARGCGARQFPAGPRHCHSESPRTAHIRGDQR